MTSGKLTLSAEQLKLLDLDGDGKVTNNDASVLMANYVGKKPSTTSDNNYYISLGEVNDAPLTKEDHYSINEDTNLETGASILQNDLDVEGNALTANQVSGPAHGTLTLHTDGTFIYVPEADFNGEDSFTYRANDGKVDSEEQTVAIDVKVVNDTPVAKEASLEVTEDETATGQLEASDSDGDTLTYSLVEDGKKGNVTITDAKTGAFTYTPAANENGVDSFTFKVNDGTVDSEVVTIDVNIKAVNDAPSATKDSYSVNEDSILDGTSILANDVDADGDELNATLVSGPAHGTFTLRADGTFTYQPEGNFNGKDSFTYKLNDGKIDSEEQTVAIDVKAVNDNPIAKADSLEVTEDETATGQLEAVDIDGDSLSYHLVENGKKGNVTITDAQTGAFTYKPNANENGTDSFTFKVNDGTVDSEVVTIDVNIKAVNDAPSATKDSYSVNEDSILDGTSILANDVDADGDELNATLVSGPAHGTFTLEADGTFTYQPEANFNGKDSFTYKLNDGKIDSEEQTVAIDVKAVNDTPVAKADSLEVTEDETATGQLEAVDIDGDSLSYHLVENGKKGDVTITDAQTGAFTYKPNANENGTDSFTFKVNDGTTDSEVVKIDVDITAVNDAPSVSNLSISGKFAPGETVQGSYTYADEENDAEGTSTFKWYRGSQPDGSDKVAISGANSTTYLIQDEDDNHYLFFEVTPVAVAGEQANQPFLSDASTKVFGQAVLTATSFEPLIENSLKSEGAGYLDLEISGDRFNADMTASDFELNHAPVGLKIVDVYFYDEGSAGLLFEYDGTDFDSDITDFSVTAKATATTKGQAITSNPLVIKTSQDAPTAFISEYLQGPGFNSALEVYYPNGSDPAMLGAGLQLEIHKWKNGQKVVTTEVPYFPGGVWPGMTYNIIDHAFYDAFDVTTMMYYNLETELNEPGVVVSALVLKKDGKVIDTVGDPTSNQPIFATGGTMVRKTGINDGLPNFDASQWNKYIPVNYSFFGRHNN
ncbi:tandem-95 repeat protein [Neobacillus drentensis]|uniref:tandem-95 repeat protein n=1 Tax=Neobacillus drentensis TaxID=220684 RepID=UPI0030009A06